MSINPPFPSSSQQSLCDIEDDDDKLRKENNNTLKNKERIDEDKIDEYEIIHPKKVYILYYLLF